MRTQNIKYYKLIFAFVAWVAFCACGTSCSISDAKIGVSEHTSAVSVDVDDATEPVDRGTTASITCEGDANDPFVNCDSALTDQNFLKAKGRTIVYAKGEQVFLRGTYIGGCFVRELWMLPIIKTANVRDESTIYSTLEARFGALAGSTLAVDRSCRLLGGG